MILDNEAKVLYLESAVDSVFKILPLYEEKNEGLELYVESLVAELYGAVKTIGMQNIADYISFLATLEAVKQDIKIDDNKKDVKRNVFKSINTLKNVISRIDGETVA